MTKIDVINRLTENGIFESTQEILDIISADQRQDHSSANKDIASMIESIHQMQNWTLFSWRTMIDTVAQVYGFTKYLAYNNLDVCADVVDQVEELHTILWNNFSSMEVWNA